MPIVRLGFTYMGNFLSCVGADEFRLQDSLHGLRLYISDAIEEQGNIDILQIVTDKNAADP